MQQIRPGRTTVVLMACLAACLGPLAVPGSAAGGAGAARPGTSSERYQSASLQFVETAPGRASGYRVWIDYVNPDDRRAKPPSVRRVVEVFMRGTEIDTRAPARCRASDAELIAAGRSACARASIVGDGFIRVDTGVPGPGRFLNEDVTFFNNTGQLIYLTRDRATGARTVVRARVSGRRVVTESPPLPGAPPDGGAIDVVRASFPRLVRVRDGQRRAYVTTPRHCPARGYWVNAVRFAYQGGTTQAERSRSRCTR